MSLQEKVDSNQLNSNSHIKQNFEKINHEGSKIISVSPNHSSDITTILLNVEQNIEEAKLVVYDLNGKILNNLRIKERGNGIQKSIYKDNLGSGTYILNLYVNGKSLDSKKIIFK